VLASATGLEHAIISVWDAASGRLNRQLEGHTGWVCKLAFTKDGQRLISAATDQTLRSWDASNWTKAPRVLRGHTDEVHAVAISEKLIASAGKDGNVMLWPLDGESASNGYSRLPESLKRDQVFQLDRSRALLLPSGQPPELVDLKGAAPPEPLPEMGSSANVLGCFGTNLLCHWNGTNQILLHELRYPKWIQRGVITLDSGIRPTGVAYNPTRQFLAWTESTSSNSVYLANLAAPGRRIELKSDVVGMDSVLFGEDGNYLAAMTGGGNSFRVWNVESGQLVVSIDESLRDATFAGDGRVLVTASSRDEAHEIRFYDLARPDQAPQCVRGKYLVPNLAVSPDGGLVAAATYGGVVRLFDTAKGQWIEDLHGHLNAALDVAFSPDGKRLISTYGGREAVKLWDVGTRQELLTLGGTGILGVPRWSADGDVILAGLPWQAWRAPSWEEIDAAEAQQRADAGQP
jgi:WD40 repeat protein